MIIVLLLSSAGELIIGEVVMHVPCAEMADARGKSLPWQGLSIQVSLSTHPLILGESIKLQNTEVGTTCFIRVFDTAETE